MRKKTNEIGRTILHPANDRRNSSADEPFSLLSITQHQTGKRDFHLHTNDSDIFDLVGL